MRLPVGLLLVGSHPSLDAVEELLDRVQPGRILRVEEHVGFELPRCLVDGRVLVNGGVVHQDDDLLPLGIFVNTQFGQRPVEEVVEDDGVRPPFSNLR
jgi:hypothetical protein